MTTASVAISEDAFDALFPLIENHIDPHATWCLGTGRGCLFGTTGEELAFVRSQPSNAVWTLVDGDDGCQYLISGACSVNRVGYVISTTLVPEGVTVEVRLQGVDDADAALIEGGCDA